MGQNPECGMGQVCIHLGTLSSEGFPLSRGCLISAFHSLPRFGARDPFVLRCADPSDSPVKFLHDYSSLRRSKPPAWCSLPQASPLGSFAGSRSSKCSWPTRGPHVPVTVRASCYARRVSMQMPDAILEIVAVGL